MTIEAYGVTAECEVDASGRLLINLITDRDVRVLVNGEPIKSDSGQVQASRFWTADGKQTDQPPLDLRGEER